MDGHHLAPVAVDATAVGGHDGAGEHRRGQGLGRRGEPQPAAGEGGRGGRTGLGGRDRLHATGNVHPDHVAADQVEPRRAAAGDHLGVVDARPLADQEQRRGAVRVDAGGAVPAQELGREVADPGVEEFEAAGCVLEGHERGEVLRGQAAFEHLGPAFEIRHGRGVAPAVLAAGPGPQDGLDRPRQPHRLAGIGRDGPRVDEREPPRLHVEPHMGHERRHHHDRRALPHPRLELPLGEVAVGGGPAAERLGERGQRAAGGRGLHAGLEPPAEGVGAVREARDRAVERDGGQVRLQATRVAGEGLGVEPAAGRGERHRDLELTAAGVGLVHVLLLDRRVEGEDADRPAGADIVGERGPGLGSRIGAVERAGVVDGGAGAAERRGRLADVFAEPLVE